MVFFVSCSDIEPVEEDIEDKYYDIYDREIDKRNLAEFTAVTDQYLKNKVGEENFYKMFKLANEGHNTNNQTGNGYLRYYFLPLELFDDNARIVVHFTNWRVTFANMVPYCIDDPSWCEFNINREEAIQIAKRNGFRANDLKTTAGLKHGLVIEVNSCSRNKAMYIDYRNGDVLGFEDKTICGGVY